MKYRLRTDEMYLRELSSTAIRWTTEEADAHVYLTNMNLLSHLSSFGAYLFEERIVVEACGDDGEWGTGADLPDFIVQVGNEVLNSGKLSYGELFALRRYWEV